MAHNIAIKFNLRQSMTRNNFDHIK